MIFFLNLDICIITIIIIYNKNMDKINNQDGLNAFAHNRKITKRENKERKNARGHTKKQQP